MLRCPHCSEDIPHDAPAGGCPHCGAALTSASTLEAEAGAARVRRQLGGDSQLDYQLSVRDPIGDARFAPGHIFAGRYRIVSLLGRGAMGEVYRADDLRIGQPIALKLLAVPAVREAQVQQFVAEVRLARDIAHPNVCRVYDIGRADGWHYLSMEYVDGETLASLLRRIGRMPSEKAMDIARQLCAGLAAAHEVGVLHRDIKPSNIMVDGRGRVRLTDFGLAVSTGEWLRGEVAGTPAYMAPEQLAGDRVTERTDLYALGLVLYELFTGRSLFTVQSIDERLRFGHVAPPIGSLSLLGIDPAVGEIIRSCVERDPAARPVSALAVAAALPGDALTVAVAEGRVLSPDMIAAAGPSGGFRPGIAWCLFALVTIGAFVVAAQIGTLTQIRPVAIPKPPEALAERVRQILQIVDTGTGGSARRDAEYWFRAELSGASPTPNAPLFGIRFVYRQSPSPLIPQNLFRLVTETDPPLNVPGMALVTTDAAGLLLRFESVPAPARPASSSAALDWAPFFSTAGLSQREFVEADPDRTAPVPFDEQRHWRKQDGDSPRVTSASLNGRPVYFEVLATSPESYTSRSAFSTGRPASVDALMWVGIVLAFGISAILARYNLRHGEGDRRGARRLSVFVIIGGVLSAVLRAHHVPVGIEEMAFLLSVAGWAVVWGAFSWLIYIGLEPHVRRMWPRTLVSWTRLISGRVRDPLVGRDLLAGALAGVAVVAVRLLISDEPTPNALLTPTLESLRSTRQFTAMLAFNTLDSLQTALAALFFLLLLRRIVRNTWIAAAVLSVLSLPIITGGTWQVSWDSAAYGLLWSSLGLAVLVQLGLLPFVTMLLVNRMLTVFPLTLEVDAWYFGSSAVVTSSRRRARRVRLRCVSRARGASIA